MENRVKSVIFFGSPKNARIFIFETAIYLAEHGNSVLYISSNQWQNLPAIFHDREQSNADSLKRIKFMYLQDYESLVEKLIDLHTFSTIPTVLLLDNLDDYTKIIDPEQSVDQHLAKLCASIVYSMNICAQTLKLDKVFFCSSIVSDEKKHILQMYFNDFWTIGNNDDNEICIVNSNNRNSKVYKFKQLPDKALILKEIIGKNF